MQVIQKIPKIPPDWPKHLGYVGTKLLPGVRSPWFGLCPPYHGQTCCNEMENVTIDFQEQSKIC